MCIRAGFLCRGYVSSRVYLSPMKNKTNFETDRILSTDEKKNLPKKKPVWLFLLFGFFFFFFPPKGERGNPRTHHMLDLFCFFFSCLLLDGWMWNKNFSFG